MNLLTVENLTVTLATGSGDAQAVRNLSFNVGHGEILGVAGESGSGKTMTALSMLGLLPYKGKASGSIKFDGREILTSSKREYRDLRGKEIAMIFQDPMTSLHPMLTVEVQLTEHLRHHRKVSKEAARNSALELLATVKIPEPTAALRAHPSQFSGGMRQRIAIAMALACEPKLLIADEPTTALDVTIQAQILNLIRELRDRTRAAIILITHDLGVVAEMAQRVVVMYAGRKVEEADVLDLFERPLHPYTLGLLNSMPRLDDDSQKRLTEIPGMVPSLRTEIIGCAFAPRCPSASARCQTDSPTLQNIGNRHLVACWHPNEIKTISTA